jgi:uncharacterized membrane protein
MTNSFSNGEALRFGWTTTRANLAPLLMIGASGLGLSILSQALTRGGGAGMFLGLAVQLAQLALVLVLARVSLRLYDGEPVDLSQPGPLVQGYWPFVLTMFLYGILVSIGFALLIIPGVLLGLAFGYAPLFTADGQKDLVEAFRASSRLTRGYRGQLFGLWLLVIGVNVLGAMALGIGVVVTVPMSALALVYAFRRMQGRTEAATPHAPSLTPRAI